LLTKNEGGWRNCRNVWVSPCTEPEYHGSIHPRGTNVAPYIRKALAVGQLVAVVEVTDVVVTVCVTVEVVVGIVTIVVVVVAALGVTVLQN
jgi:hypothetical protein